MASARRRRLIIRGGVIVIIVGVSAAAAISGASALQGARRSALHSDSMRPASAQDTLVAGRSTTDTSDGTSTRDSARGLVGAPPAAPSSTSAPALGGKRALTPVIGQGRTEIRDGIFALRDGDEVTVHFDTPLSRTRRRDKLEQVIRATLPAAFGQAIDSLLSAVPAGKLVSTDGPVTALSDREIRVALAGGWTLALRPGTRAGQDGPLVISYRATVTR